VAVRLHQDVRLPSGEVTTIAKLAEQGRVRFTKSERWHSRNGVRTAYMAELLDAEGYFWEIGRLAYESRSRPRSTPQRKESQ
jgi:hypothetical protein